MKKVFLVVALAFGAAHFSGTTNNYKPAKATIAAELEPGGDEGGIPVPPPKPKFP